MSRYYIDTASGPRGPYPAEQVIAGVQQGKIPTNAMLRDADTGAIVRAVDLASQGAPVNSGGYGPAQQPSGPSPQFMPRQPQYQQPQYQQPQYAQPQYPQSPYPPPQQTYAPQYGQYPQQGTYQPYGNAQGPMPYATGEMSGLATASLTCSLVSLVVCTPLCIVGIILGIMALNECQPNGPKRGRGVALGGIWSGVGILLLMCFAIAILVALD